MKLIDRYSIDSITKVTFVTLLLCTLMLVSVDLFTHLDSYVNSNVPFFTIFTLSLLYMPEAMVFALGPSVLFSTAFHLSQLQANNELICFFNAGISYRRLLVPILMLGLFFSCLQFGVNEYLAIPFSRQRSVQQNELFGLRSTFDNRNITLSDLEGGFVVHASHYNDSTKKLTDVILVLQNEEGGLSTRIDATSAIWNEKNATWELSNAIIHELVGDTVESRRENLYISDQFTLEPSFFRNLSSDIKTMELDSAFRYLKRIKVLDPSMWHVYASDFANRILGSLTPLVLLFIACTINYTFKKNVLLFSIIMSISIAVIFYVVQMVTLIMAKQGVIGPIWGMVIPMIVIVSIAILERFFFH
ncbi:MAG: LptF/LptG family permease [Sphaerochaeta sp.]|nr:LptF/LptG family permease [Sphaerochaeta sp.]